MGKQKGRSRSWRVRGSTEEGPGGFQSTLPVFIHTLNIFKTLHYTARWRPDWKRKGLPQQFFMDLFASLTTSLTYIKRDPAAIPEENEDYSHLSLGRAAQEAGAEPSTAHPEHPTLLLPKVVPLPHSQNRPRLKDQWERGRSQLGTLWGAAWEPLYSLCCHGLTFTTLSYGKKQMRQQIEQFGSVSAIKQKSWISLTRAIAFLPLPSAALKDHRQAAFYKIQELQ